MLLPARERRHDQWRVACAALNAFLGITLAETPCGACVQAPCGAPRRRAQLLLPLRLRTALALDASHLHRAQTFRSATPRNLNPSDALRVAWQSGPVGTLPRPPRCSLVLRALPADVFGAVGYFFDRRTCRHAP